MGFKCQRCIQLTGKYVHFEKGGNPKAGMLENMG